MKYRAGPVRKRKNRLEYNPNSNDAPQWATYIPSRGPAWKVHTKKGQACGAISNCVNTIGWGHPGILYEFVRGQWVERGRAEPPEFCAHCGSDDGNYKRLDKYPSQYQFEKPFVCRDCYNDHFKATAKNPVNPKLVQVPR